MLIATSREAFVEKDGPRLKPILIDVALANHTLLLLRVLNIVEATPSPAFVLVVLPVPLHLLWLLQ